MAVSTSGEDAVLPRRRNYFQLNATDDADSRGAMRLGAASASRTVHNWELHIMAYFVEKLADVGFGGSFRGPPTINRSAIVDPGPIWEVEFSAKHSG